MQFLLDNILLIGIALISGGMLLWPMLRARSGGASLTTLQATLLINNKNAALIDVRAPEDFAKSSVPGARNIPLATLEARVSDIKKDRPVIVVCDTGSQSAKAAAQLRAAGFAEVYVLAGGVAAWRAAGLPLKVNA